MLLIKWLFIKTTLCSLSYNLLPWNCLWLVYIQIHAREFNDPNFGFSESWTKKNALNKLARMSRVRHNAKSIENRYNSFKSFTKLFETFCPLHESPRHLKRIKQLINILFCGYRRSTIRDPWQMQAETYTRLGHRVPQRVINIYDIRININTVYISWRWIQ
jgi:hypothetical protein